MKSWVVYLLICSDNSIYTGISNDLEKRIKAHNDGKGAKYTKARRPVRLLKFFKVLDKSAALKLEIKIKKLSRDQKISFEYKEQENNV